MGKYDDYLDFAVTKLQLANDRFRTVLELVEVNKEVDTLFFKQVIGAFVKEMLLSVAHLFEKNHSNNMNLQKLLKIYIDNTSKKEKKSKATKLLDNIKKVQYDEWKDLFDYRNGVIAHSDYRVYLLSKEKPKKFKKVLNNFIEALNTANEIVKFLVTNFKIETKASDQAIEELRLTIRLIKEHQEYVMIMREQEKLEFENNKKWG